jgi:hypothetical protein
MISLFELLKVLSQFKNMYETRSNMEEVYVMGHRLIVFLDEALPHHPQYYSPLPEIASLRNKSRLELDWIQKRMEVIALRVDEEQLNKFILDDLKGHQRQSTSSSPGSKWEKFSGWAMGQDLGEWEEAHDISFDSGEVEAAEVESYEDPEIESYESDYPTQVSDLPGGSYTIPEEDYGFLRKVASEEVPFETDSEAVDSWAQDSDQSSSPSPRFFNRKAFQNMINRAKTPRIQEAQDPPGLSPRALPKLACFLPMSPSYKDEDEDRQVLGIKSRHDLDKENVTISTVPSDEEDDISFRRRVRFNDAGNQTQLYVPEEYVMETMGTLSIN